MAVDPKEAAIKQRIITHMNKDHQDSVVRYLCHYCGLSSFAARNAVLEDITLFELVISSSPGILHRVPVQPAMSTWADARPRVVAMDHECVEAMGVSNITVKTYVKPYGFMLFMIVLATSVAIVFARRANLEPGSLLYDCFLQYFPPLANLCLLLQPGMTPFIVIVHLIETIWLARTRLSKHSVPLGSGLWWEWALDCFLGGGGAIYRFDQVVQQEEIRRANAKH